MRHVGAVLVAVALGCGSVSSDPAATGGKSGAAGAGGHGGELATSSGGAAGDGRGGTSGSAPATGGTTATGGTAGQTADGGTWAVCPHVQSVSTIVSAHCFDGCLSGSDAGAVRQVAPCVLSAANAAEFSSVAGPSPIYCFVGEGPIPGRVPCPLAP